MTARVLRCAVAVFTTYPDEELARHRTVLTRAAHGEHEPVEALHDSLAEGTQGLAGLAIAGGSVSALALWAARGIGHLPLSVFAALAAGVLGFSGTLAAIYGARMGRRFVRSVPRRSDFFAALSCGLLIAVAVAIGRLAGAT